MKKTRKHISLFLALVLALGMLPASVLSSAAAGAYQVLFETQYQGELNDAYNDMARVYSVTDHVYHIVRFTGSGLEDVPGTAGNDPYPDPTWNYFSVCNANDRYGVVNRAGEQIVDCIYTYVLFTNEPDTALASLAGESGYSYFLLDLKQKTASPLTEEAYHERLSGNRARYSVERSEEDDCNYLCDANGNVILSEKDKPYKISGGVFKDAGLIRVYDSETYKEGLVNFSGEFVIPIGYDNIWDVSNGYVSVCNYVENGNKISFDSALLDMAGNVVIPTGTYTTISGVSPDGTFWADNHANSSISILKLNGGSAPVTPVTPPAGTIEAMPTNDTLRVNSEVKNATVYKIDGSNYFKIRDLAAVLNSTSKQFAVGYDGESKSVTATTGQPYELAGGELAGAAPSVQTAAVSNDTIIVNGSVAENVTVYKIDGSNYFKLRDLGDALGFDVGWSAEEGMFINTEG